MRPFLPGLLTLCFGCAHPELQQTPAAEFGRDQALEIEITAIRSMLTSNGLVGRSDGWIVSIDPRFALPGHAPGSPTSTRRTLERHDALVKMVVTTMPDSGDILTVRTSDPVIDGATATISVTISYNRAHPVRRRRAGYETIGFALRRTANGWVVVNRTSLGIT
jgi:hypothetical protein